MPIEIKELVLETNLEPQVKGGDKESSLLTETDRQALKDEILDELTSGEILLPASVRRKLIDECMLRVRELLEQERRR